MKVQTWVIGMVVAMGAAGSTLVSAAPPELDGRQPVADKYLGTVDGTGVGYGDDNDQCCQSLSTLHNRNGNSVDMDNDCRSMRGDVVKRIRRSPSGYCRAWQAPAGSGYRVTCDAPMVGDCYKW